MDISQTTKVYNDVREMEKRKENCKIVCYSFYSTFAVHVCFSNGLINRKKNLFFFWLTIVTVGCSNSWTKKSIITSEYKIR